MFKKDLVGKFADLSGLSKKDAGVYIDNMFDVISEALANGEEVSISGFGKLSVKTTNARTGRNPATNEPIEIPSKKKISFKVAKDLKELVNR